MIPKIVSFLLFTLLILCHLTFASEQLKITGDGKANYRIMIASNPHPIEDFAAHELQGYVMQVSGVFLPLDKGTIRASEKYILIGSGGIRYLGLRINEEYLGADGFIIKNIGDNIIIVGGSPRGTLFGVYAFLEKLGCRWMAPGIIGEVIPQILDIAINPIEETEKPDIIYRGFTNLLPVTQESSYWIDWMAKNKMNYFVCQLSNFDEFKRILGGELERRGMYLGVNFDSLIYPNTSEQNLTDSVLEFLEKNPEVDIIQIPIEILNVSQEEYLQIIVDIRKKLKERYPNKNIRLMINNNSIPNISYSNANLINPASSNQQPISRKCYSHSIGDKKCRLNRDLRTFLEGNAKTIGISHIYEYYMGSYEQNSLPFPILNTIVNDLKYFNNLPGVEGVISQCELGNWGAYGLNYYAFAKMAWDTSLNSEVILDDYCHKYYDSASEPMRTYYKRLEDLILSKEHLLFIEPPQLILELFDKDILSELELELDKAEDMANDAAVFERIRKVFLSFNHAKLLWGMLDDYSKGIQHQEAENSKKAKEHYKGSIESGEKLMAFLFQNINENVFIIPESYIFDYIQKIIEDARDRIGN